MITAARTFASMAILPALLALFSFASLTAEEPLKDGVTPFPLDHCATCSPDEKGEALVTKTHKGREIKLCKGCVRAFTADPDGYVKKVDKVIKDAEKAKEAKPADK